MLRVRRSDRGSGLLSAALGLGVVVGMIGLAVNVALGLWTSATVDSVAYDAAREVATRPPAVPARAAEQQATSRARSTLGPIGRDVRLEFLPTESEWVHLRVRAPGVALLPAFLRAGPTVGAVDRTIVLTREAT